jgi:menaquinone-dependent protoporphyrinogen IX oxidase
MMRVLVTGATKYGATAEIAAAIAEALGKHGLEATVLPPEQVERVDGYDTVVVGSAVYAGHWLKPARELVERHARDLAGRPVWLFSSGPVGDPPKPEEDPVDVADLLAATEAREHRVFAGKLTRKQLSFPERAIVSALRVPEGTSGTGPKSGRGRPASPTPYGEASPSLYARPEISRDATTGLWVSQRPHQHGCAGTVMLPRSRPKLDTPG